MSCNLITEISGNECIGDSRVKINDNFLALESVVCDLSTNTIYAYPSNSIDLSFTPSTRALTAVLIPGAISSQSNTTVLSAGDLFLLNREGNLRNIAFEDFTNNLDIKFRYFRAVERYNMADASANANYLLLPNRYGATINDISPTYPNTSYNNAFANTWRRFNAVEANDSFAEIATIGAEGARTTHIRVTQAGRYIIQAGAAMVGPYIHNTTLLAWPYSVITSGTQLSSWAAGLTTNSSISALAIGELQNLDPDATDSGCTSLLEGYFYLPANTGLALVHTWRNTGNNVNNVYLGGRAYDGYYSGSSWASRIVPLAVTAWMNIQRIP